MANSLELTAIPDQLYSGERRVLRLIDESVSYPPSDFTVTLQLRLGSAAPIIVNMNNSDGEHKGLLELTGRDAGLYNYVLSVEDADSNKATIASGTLTVLADPANSDARTHAQRVLENIEAVIENRATKDQQSYSIAGRSLTRMSVDELIKWREHYRQEVSRERATQAGGSSRKVFLARFS